ncbi:CDP-glucose 4,6-dehydratase [Microvirga mediterraneensis]|uniref:CDP-glucose 4,6-dehydratase n=1 Tax=Microvirga mediterraneensis TaxID=2754695 RepID=A0A838BT05_9HYPH|nr:CDP-glucose 4,6-dehydratase [Microvirga mediterraneensis]MBA1158179.1 CDP-glucose 4,6-dehydratase [Microvirga mediterraneensis]
MGRLSASQALDSYKSRRVLVTGHTGFKGSWLTGWLHALGAEVTGFSLAPDQGPDNLFDQAGIDGLCCSRIGDIRNFDAVRSTFEESRPEIVLHLAAQPLVPRSYADPVGTMATNVLGTTHVLEAARLCSSVNAVVCVTTDKVYRNHEWAWPYRETDELGGFDPYSASKAGAEMVARSYRTALAPKDRPFALATARGGNVLGGGDWSADRLVPDMVRALRAGVPLEIRHPNAIRPWQHVLDLCYAYLLIGAVLRERADGVDVEAWNIGPDPSTSIPVQSLASLFFRAWGAPDHPITSTDAVGFESRTLSLDSSLARSRLGWAPVLGAEEIVRLSAQWYRGYVNEPNQARVLMDAQRTAFEQRLVSSNY